MYEELYEWLDAKKEPAHTESKGVNLTSLKPGATTKPKAVGGIGEKPKLSRPAGGGVSSSRSARPASGSTWQRWPQRQGR